MSVIGVKGGSDIQGNMMTAEVKARLDEDS